MTKNKELAEGGNKSITNLMRKSVILKAIIEGENTNLQILKLVQNWGMQITIIIISLLRGKGNNSVIGITKCSFADWGLFFLMLFVAVLLSIFAIVLLSKEYNQKVAAGYDFIPGDLQCTKSNVIKLLTIAFVGGFASGAFGIGLGSIFNPIFLALDVNPTVAGSTGVYLSLFSCMTTSIFAMIDGLLQPQFTCLMLFLTILGTIPGIKN